MAKNRIVLIGDQVCADCCPVVKGALSEVAEVWLAPRVVTTSVDLLVGIREWILPRQPEIAVLASGIMDTRRLCFAETERLVPLSSFERNARCAMKIVRENTASAPLWVTIAPVDRRRVKSEAEFGYDNETISQYNEEAKEVARAMGVEVFDLYGIVKAASRADSWRPDGLRFDARSRDYLAEKLAAKLGDMCRF